MADDIMQTFKRKVSGKFIPCPFCGMIETIGVYTWQDINETDDEDTSEYDKTHYAVCCDLIKGGCGAVKGGDYETPDEAVEGWNRRA